MKDFQVEKEIAKPIHVEQEINARRTATPPVSFKVGGPPNGQDHDRMDVDAEVGHSKKKGIKVKKDKVEEQPAEDDEDIVIEEDDDMAAMMGFGGFGTTHQKKVAGNDVYAVRKEKKTEYRQYMNRVGGFNRPLSPPRE
jgi:U4/U6.U5 tri-snRNP-associated protein 3